MGESSTCALSRRTTVVRRSWPDSSSRACSTAPVSGVGCRGPRYGCVSSAVCARTNHPPRRREVPVSMSGSRVSVDDVSPRHETPSQTRTRQHPRSYSGTAMKQWILREVSMYGGIWRQGVPVPLRTQPCPQGREGRTSGVWSPCCGRYVFRHTSITTCSESGNFGGVGRTRAERLSSFEAALLLVDAAAGILAIGQG